MSKFERVESVFSDPYWDSTCVPKKRSLGLSPDYNSVRMFRSQKKLTHGLGQGNTCRPRHFGLGWWGARELSSTRPVPRILDHTFKFLSVSTCTSFLLRSSYCMSKSTTSKLRLSSISPPVPKLSSGFPASQYPAWIPPFRPHNGFNRAPLFLFKSQTPRYSALSCSIDFPR